MQNQEKHEVSRIQSQNYENHENLIIPYQNQQNREIPRNRRQNNENHENLNISS